MRAFGLAPEVATRIHEGRFRQLVREAEIAEVRQLKDHVVHQRRALQVALLLDLGRASPTPCSAWQTS